MRAGRWMELAQDTVAGHLTFDSPLQILTYLVSQLIKSRDSSVGIGLAYGLDDRGSNPAEGGNFSLHHRIHTGSGVHSAPYPVGTRGSSPRGKSAGA
jgi:hypothetical protein